MEDALINKVANSELKSIDLEAYYLPGIRKVCDIKPWLYESLLLREKDFRAFVKAQDWSQYDGCYVAITCTADAIIPTWAYMLVALELQPYAKKVVFGDLMTLETVLYEGVLSTLDLSVYKDQRVVIKGCGKLPVPVAAYTELAGRLRAIAKSVMYGEPCSTVPLFKKKV
jgi:hypothetical protein